MIQPDWEQALSSGSPEALATLFAQEPIPTRINGMPWQDALALRVAQEQWISNKWLTTDYEEWMALWQAQRTHVDFLHRPRSGMVFSLLEQMSKVEDCYQPGKMHLDLWLAFVDDLVSMGMALDQKNWAGGHPLVQLLTHTTVVPYPSVARHWIERHDLAFPAMTGATTLGVLDRLIPVARSTGSSVRLSSDAEAVLAHAIQSTHPQGLAKAFQAWADRHPGHDIASLCRLAVARELEESSSVPPPKGAGPRL